MTVEVTSHEATTKVVAETIEEAAAEATIAVVIEAVVAEAAEEVAEVTSPRALKFSKGSQVLKFN
jgi:hypothetical protein